MIFNDNLAKVAEQYLKKGMKVYIEGQLQTRKWQDQTGQDRYTTEVVLQKFRGELQMLDARGQGGGQVGYSAAPAAAPISASPARRRPMSGNRGGQRRRRRRASRASSTTKFRSEGLCPTRSPRPATVGLNH